MLNDTTRTCGECGLDPALPRARALEHTVEVFETEAEKLSYRVKELEQVIRAFVKGSASINTLRAVVNHA